MCGGGGRSPAETPVEIPVEMPNVTQEQINAAIQLPPGFTARPVSFSEGGGYQIVDADGDVYQSAETFGGLVSAANNLDTLFTGNTLYDPGANQFIDSTTGQPVTSSEVQFQPRFQERGAVGGRRVGIPGAEEDVPGITELAYGLMAEGVQLPEQQLAGFTPTQQQAFELARQGVGSFRTYLDLGTALTQEGVTSLEDALLGTRGLAGQIPSELRPGQGALSQSEYDARRLAEQGVQDVRQARYPSYLAGEQARGLAADVTGQARALRTPLESQLADVTQGARGLSGRGITGADVAAERARMSTTEAQQSLQEAAQLGRQTAMEGIAQLAGTGAMFSPDQAQAFMSEYEDAAVQQALRDIARQGELQQQELGARAVQAGAFGGSRQAVAEQELARNVLEQQGRTAAQMRAAGFESASQRAQQAFEQAKARQQSAAQLTGQLGQIGVGASAQAAQAAGQLGLSAEELAQRSALQGAQLGLSAEQMAAANAQALSQTGLNIEQLAASTGMNAQQLAGQMAGQAGQLGLSAGQLGIQGAQAAGNLGLQSSQLGLSGIQAGLGAQQQAAGIGTGIAGLGQQMVGLGQQGQQLNLQDINTMLGIGGQEQRQEQAALDVAYQNQYQQAMQPYQQLAFASDIITGAPSGQASTMSYPGPSVGSQLLGLGIGAYGLSQALK